MKRRTFERPTGDRSAIAFWGAGLPNALSATAALAAALSVTAALVAASSVTAARAAASSPTIAGGKPTAGIFAIPGSRAKTAEMLRVDRLGPLDARIDLAESARGVLVRDYNVEMTKRLHLIAVGEDFGSFQHLHPALERSGHFTTVLHVPRPGRYYLFADTEPRGYGKQVFRFALRFGDAGPQRREIARPAKTARTGPYDVTIDSLALRAAESSELRITIARDRHLARDLHPYLGGAAHAVFIDTKTLGYLHVHPVTGDAMAMAGDRMAMTGAHGETSMAEAPALADSAKVPAKMLLHVRAPSPGTYRLWLQFRGADGLHVAPFVLTAR